jgi:hypothetical protein
MSTSTICKAIISSIHFRAELCIPSVCPGSVANILLYEPIVQLVHTFSTPGQLFTLSAASLHQTRAMVQYKSHRALFTLYLVFPFLPLTQAKVFFRSGILFKMQALVAMTLAQLKILQSADSTANRIDWAMRSVSATSRAQTGAL